MIPGERQWLGSVVANLLDDALKLVYADWLEEQGDDRAVFLRQFVAASRSMNPADFPPDDDLEESWLELIGYRLLQRAAQEGVPELREPMLRLARPALRFQKVPVQDQQLERTSGRCSGDGCLRLC